MTAHPTTKASFDRGRSARWFVAALCAVVALFLGSGAYVRHQVRGIDQDARSIVHNAGPSIRELAGTQTALEESLLRLDDYLDTAIAGGPADPAALDRARRTLASTVRAYLALPNYPGEDASWRPVESSLADVETLMDDIAARVARGDLTTAHEIQVNQLQRAGDRTSAALLRLIDFHAEQAQRLADEIARSRRTADRAALWLDTLSTALAIIAGAIALRGIRRSDALSRAYRRDAEQRAEEQGLFAARVAHDIRSPLATVGLTLQLIERDAESRPALVAASARGRRALDRVVRIVDGLFDFARAGARPQAGAHTEVGAVLDDLLDELGPEAQAADVELRKQPFAPVEVACSTGVLTSVFANLLRNALKYITDSPVRRITVRVLERGTRARVEIEDTGPGLPDALRDAIFEPYVRGPTTGKPGLGIGLATVKRLCETHHGAVGEEPAPGGGCVFWFELPRFGGQSPAAQA